MNTYEKTRVLQHETEAKCLPEVWQWKAAFGEGREYRAVLCGKRRDTKGVESPIFIIEVRGDDDALGQPSWRRVSDESGFAMALNLIWSQREASHA